MGSQTPPGGEKRRHQRMDLELPVKATMGGGDHVDLEIVDISAVGMQIRSKDFDVLKGGFDSQSNTASFEIHIVARLAWARPEPDGGFVTGWEFDREEDEPRIG